MLGYLGPNGTFSHQAAMEWSEGKEEIKEFSTIYSVILAVEKGELTGQSCRLKILLTEVSTQLWILLLLMWIYI